MGNTQKLGSEKVRDFLEVTKQGSNVCLILEVLVFHPSMPDLRAAAIYGGTYVKFAKPPTPVKEHN